MTDSGNAVPPPPPWVVKQDQGKMHCVPVACEMLLCARLGSAGPYLNLDNYDPVGGASFSQVARDIDQLHVGLRLMHRDFPDCRFLNIKALVTDGHQVAIIVHSRHCPETCRTLLHAQVVAGVANAGFQIVDGLGTNRIALADDSIFLDPHCPEVAWLE